MMFTDSMQLYLIGAAVLAFYLAGIVAAVVSTLRDDSVRDESSIWVATCPERHCPALIQLLKCEGNTVVQDCSLADHSACGRSCTALVHDSERAREAARSQWT